MLSQGYQSRPPTYPAEKNKLICSRTKTNIFTNRGQDGILHNPVHSRKSRQEAWQPYQSEVSSRR